MRRLFAAFQNNVSNWKNLEIDMTDMIDNMSDDEWKRLIDNATDVSDYAKLYGFDEQDGLAAMLYHILGGGNDKFRRTTSKD